MTQDQCFNTLENEVVGNAAKDGAARKGAAFYSVEKSTRPLPTELYKELDDKLDEIISLIPFPQI